jgi:tetratricopeptide (TPR) repeat protein
MPFPSIPSPSRLGALIAFAVAAGCLVPAAAAAPADSARPDPQGDAAARARAHYRQGEDAFKAGRFEEAYRQWQLGFQLSNRPLFLVNMAHAQRRRGDLRNARALYQRFLLMEPQTKLREEVEVVLEEIDSALAAEPAGLGVEPRPLEAAEPETAAPVSGEAPPAPDAAIVPPPIVPPPLYGRVPPPAPPLIDHAAPPPGDRASPRPIYRRWWFWASAGGALALGVAATFLLRGEAYDRNGSIGTLGMPP